jgi:hypothetical protein
MNTLRYIYAAGEWKATEMKVVRRLGATPRRLGNTTDVSGSPDILQLEDGAIAVIGVDITDQVEGLDRLQARCAPGERVVRVPRNTFAAARPELPAE